MTTSNQRWRKKNPLKLRAHWTVQNALRAGLIKPLSCQKCGKEKAHAHHEDYTKPFEIIWLCPVCHRKEHLKGQTPKIKKPKQAPIWPFCKQYQPAPKREKLLSRVQELKKAGASYGQIAEQVSISKSQVYKWLNPKAYK